MSVGCDNERDETGWDLVVRERRAWQEATGADSPDQLRDIITEWRLMKRTLAATVVQSGHEGTGPAIWDLVIADLERMGPCTNGDAATMVRVINDGRARDAFGTAKYGWRLRAHDGRDSTTDAYQEELDRVAYKRKEVAEGRATMAEYWRALADVIATREKIDAEKVSQGG